MWGNSNNSLVTQYLKDDNQTIDTYSLTIKNISTTTEVSLAGTAVAKNITDISSFGKEFFYLTEGTNSSLGYVGDFAGTKVKQIWNSNITQLNSQFINSKTVALTTKPARYVLGYMYTVDTTTGAKRKILGDVAGLSTLSDGLVEQIFYLENGAASRAFIFNSKTGVTSDITPTTFPEKCVWSKKSKNVMFCGVPRSSINPDSLTQWYQGLISTDDDIWKYNTKDNTTTIVGTLPESSEGGIDVTKPMLSENEQYLVFTNKKDNTLWSLDLLK